MKKLLALVLLAGLAFSPMSTVNALGVTKTLPNKSHAKVTAHTTKAKAHKKLAAHRGNAHKTVHHTAKAKLPAATIHQK